MVKLRVKIFSFLILLALGVQASAYSVQFADKAKTLRLHWKSDLIRIELSTSLSTELPLVRSNESLPAIVGRSLDHWKEIANVDFEIAYTDAADVSPAGLRGDGVNLITIASSPDNILFFDGESDTAAKTRIFYNGKGEIVEGDIVLNPHQLFSDDGTAGTFDLEAALTHEIGHLLGLGHTEINGATMQGHHAKNGIYTLPVAAFRTLSEDDIAGARALYGAALNEEALECCGAVNGKFNLGKEKVKDLQVWLEESRTGRIAAGTVTDLNGAWNLEGLRGGKYNLFVQSLPDNSEAKTRKTFSAERIGEVTIENGKTLQFEKAVVLKPRKLTLDYLGFNAQLSKLAIPVNTGKIYALNLADKTLPAAGLKVQLNSPFVTIVPDSLRKTPFSSEVTAYLVDVKIAENAPPGEYSLRLQNKLGETIYLVGALTVEPSVANPWVSYFSEVSKF